MFATYRGAERVVLYPKATYLGLKVADTLLQTPHLGNESGIGTTDVAEKRLRHNEDPPH